MTAQAAAITPKRSSLSAAVKLYAGSVKEAIAVRATMITMIGLTIPARTAASPITWRPTIPMV
ncbi:hypothetical protein PRECH8_03920 [Insulibacter thermoxylanivorax]|uniref:Uncharacterized protein n=1 Tax=Insulibacter thermoxylanivorax TaxID=2749268 RepID=A0A916QEM4_9BACL|nr:hypothetical protein PRECH8_03920 [Insulibacter thermoxylanivorax]